MRLTDIFVAEIKNFNAGDYKRPRRVLIVEDDKEIGNMLKATLESDEVKATLLDSTDKVMDFIEKTIPFTHIFMDLNFPRGDDGAVMIGKIRAAIPNAPVTIITGYISPELEAVAKEKNCGLLYKGTFQPDDIVEIVRKS